jgi:hypothetical protein
MTVLRRPLAMKDHATVKRENSDIAERIHPDRESPGMMPKMSLSGF